MTRTIWSARLAAVGAGVALATALTATTPATASASAVASGTVSGGGQANIIGGSDASRPYPFVALEYTYYPELGHSSSCTATLVTVPGPAGPVTGAVINANCVTNYPSTEPEAASDITLEVGSTHLDKLTSVTPTRVEVYPGWDWATADIAVLALPQNLHLTGIAIGDRPAPGRKVRLVGWGDASIETPGLPPVLQQLDTRITTPSACADAAIGAGEICVAPAANGGQACFGDAGAPALAATRTGWVVLGSGSRGTNETDCTGPTVFTNTSYYQKWITQALTKPQPRHPHHVTPSPATSPSPAPRAVTFAH